MSLRWVSREIDLLPDSRPRVMGILNVTPDSFSDGGRSFVHESAIANAAALIEEGADILDIGGESSRPGASIVALDEELRRVIPVIESISETHPQVLISIDTSKAEVAKRAIGAGASIINDIGGLRDLEMRRVAADSGVAVVVMHMAGNPQTMQDNPSYHDVVEEVYVYLARQVELAIREGIAAEKIAIDPGIGFGKTHGHNLDLLRGISRFATLGFPVLVGTSRKGFLGKLTGRSIEQRATASVISSLSAAIQGASILRVHDVGPMVDAIRIWEAVHGWGTKQ